MGWGNIAVFAPNGVPLPRDLFGSAIETIGPGTILHVPAGARVDFPPSRPRPVICTYCGTSRAGDVARCESCGATERE